MLDDDEDLLTEADEACIKMAGEAIYDSWDHGVLGSRDGAMATASRAIRVYLSRLKK